MTKKPKTGEWYAIAIPHNYNDGTTHRWAVRYETADGRTVEIADWLTEKVAHEVSATQEMLRTLLSIVSLLDDPQIHLGRTLNQQILTAIDKATGASS